MKNLASLFTALFITTTVWGVNQNSGRKQLIDDEWQFSQDSAEWRTVNLPHDWSVEGMFDKNAPAGNDGAYLPTGKGWYKKQFTIHSSQFLDEPSVTSAERTIDKKLRLYFEGVYMNAEVYINGQRAGGHPYGYSSFFVDITPYVQAGEANEVVVRVDNSQQKNCRWYSGSGIYRHVWLLTTGKRYIDEWSVSVTTPNINTVNIEAEVVMEDGTRKPIEKTLHVENPHLWSPDDPYLYKTTLEAEGDVLPVTYGIRTIEYSADKGLILNGKSIVLNGGCVHHDNGILGAAAFDAAEYRKVRLLKEAGFNAVRTSHNPPSEAFLRACDELGLLVIDEAFDGWREKKNDYDYSTLIDQWWQKDLQAMVLRDRNHPSVFCWSIGNEIIERKKPEAVQTAHEMAALCRELDKQHRPVTSALASWDSDWEI
ncbi:MAG: beta-galactosidase, partial [Bacteroidaceae bacterium]|nr:beta-galactosidase [Bacteroidaceae bacterium]